MPDTRSQGITCRLLLLLFLFSHYPIATVQSVVTGQDPITLERKITSGGRQIKHNKTIHTITETNRIPQTLGTKTNCSRIFATMVNLCTLANGGVHLLFK